MDSGEANAIRRDFKTFIGEERYREFVQVLNRSPITLERLRFWQEDLWNKFVTASPKWPRDFMAVREAFRTCEIHGEELRRETILATAGWIQWRDTDSPQPGPRENPFRFDIEFPYAGLGVDPAKWNYQTREVDVWFCPECRRLRTEYEFRNSADNGNKKSWYGKHLVRQTNLEELALQFGVHSIPDVRLEKWNRMRDEIQALLRDGGELWEYESDRFREFHGSCGIALVRDGLVFKEWHIGRS